MEGEGYDFSVIVVVYNQPLTLDLIFRSLLAQKFSGSYEVIICDDGSSSNLLSQYLDEFNTAKIPIKYVWQQDRGFRAAAARNNGIRISKGRYLLFLDGDTIPPLTLLQKHLEAHNKEKLLIAGNRKWRGEITLEEWRSLKEKPIGEILLELDTRVPDKKSQHREKIENERRKTWLSSPHPWRICFSGHLSVKRAPEIYFDENFVGWGPEDWELSYRLWKHYHYTPVYCEEIVAYHLESPEAIGNVFRRGTHREIVQYMKNTFYFFQKCPELKLEEIFFGFPRFALDPHTDTWHVIPRPPIGSYNLAEIVEEIRNWLVRHGEL